MASLPDILRGQSRDGEARRARSEQSRVRSVDAAYFADLVRFVVPPLVKALHKEPETEVQAAMLESPRLRWRRGRVVSSTSRA